MHACTAELYCRYIYFLICAFYMCLRWECTQSYETLKYFWFHIRRIDIWETLKPLI